MSDKADKYMVLGTYCGILARAEGATPANLEAQKIAAALARELFPPMALALVWDESPNAWSCVYGYYIPKASAEALFDGTPLGYFRDVPQAKAACEAHHQARFLEQLA